MTENMRKIDPKSLVPMDRLAPENAFRIQLAYARDDNLLFGERIYRPNARLWLHEELAEVVAMAASACFENYDLRFVLYDGLRTTDAQEAMLRTERVRGNPEWLSENLLSRPGMGGHPRGMAVDIGLENEKGELVPWEPISTFWRSIHRPRTIRRTAITKIFRRKRGGTGRR
jgi:D-alanyl-D-alanine dipeptidase